MKKANNQGFSLVELIIVIAIMAVLVGVLAPQFIKYVESSRKQKDASAVEEARNAVEIALAEVDIYDEVVLVGAAFTVVIPDDAAFTSAATVTKLLASLSESIGTIDFGSKTYSSGATITITPNASNNFTVTAAANPVTP